MFKAKINAFLIIHFLSIVIAFESLFMFLAVIVSLIYRETITERLLLASVTAFFIGVLLNILTKKQRHVVITSYSIHYTKLYECLPVMRAHDEPAHVVLTASIGGWLAGPDVGAYCASKFAVVGLGEAMSYNFV